MAQRNSRAEVVNHDEHEDIVEALKEMTGGMGPDACIDAVGMEAHGYTWLAAFDQLKQMLHVQLDRATVLREIAQVCRKGEALSIPGVYGRFIDKVPFGSIFSKALRVATGQTHCHRYLRPLLERVERGEIDPSFVITHRLALEDAPEGYRMFQNKQDECIKIVLDPWEERRAA